MTMHVVRHRLASSTASDVWEFDPCRRVVDIVMRQGNAEIAFRVDICSMLRPRAFAHPVMRVNGEMWRILPRQFVPIPGHPELYEPRDCRIHMALGPGVALMLANTPAHCDVEFECL